MSINNFTNRDDDEIPQVTGQCNRMNVQRYESRNEAKK